MLFFNVSNLFSIILFLIFPPYYFSATLKVPLIFPSPLIPPKKKLGESEFSVKKGSNFNFDLPISPSHSYFYISERPSTSKDVYDPAAFCKITQPDPTLFELKKIALDFPDKLTQESLLFLDNYIFLSLSNGSLISYALSLTPDNSSIDSLTFSQEIPNLFNNSIANNNVNTSAYRRYSKLLFSNYSKQILLMAYDKVHMISTTFIEQRMVMIFNRSFHVNGSITHTQIYDNFIYLVLNFTTLEIYDLRDFFQYHSIPINTLIDPGNNNLAVNSIAINSDFLLILENSTNCCYFFDRLGLMLRNTLFFNGSAKIVKAFLDTVFVYYQHVDGQMFLQEFIRYGKDSNYYIENNIFEMKSPAKSFKILDQNLLLSTHENLLTFIRHSVQFPKNITSSLKKTLAFEGVQRVSPWGGIINANRSDNSTDMFFDNSVIVSNRRELHFFQLVVQPGGLTCLAGDSVATHKYETNLLLYYFNCTIDIDGINSDNSNCQSSLIKNDKIRVVLDVYQELFESSNIALAIGLGIGFSLAFVITVVFCVYFYRIKHHYTTLVKEISPQEGKNKITRPLKKKSTELESAEERMENGINISSGNQIRN